MADTKDYSTAQRIFRTDLAAKLYQTEGFVLQSQDWSADARGNKVSWQEDQQEPNVIINNKTNALTASNKDEIARDFDIDEYQSVPHKINYTEELLTNYQKRQNLIESHLKAHRKTMALRILYNWMKGAMANSRIIETSGSAVTGLAPSATGNRKAIQYKDIIAMQAQLIKDEVEMELGKLNLLIPVAWQQTLMNLSEFKSRDFYPIGNNSSPIIGGMMVIGTIAGCNVFVRSSTLACDKTDYELFVPKADNALNARTATADDSLTALMWHSDYVVRAANFNKIGKDARTSLVNIIPIHGGTEFSLTAIAGGNSYYQKGQGTAVLVETASA